MSVFPDSAQPTHKSLPPQLLLPFLGGAPGWPFQDTDPWSKKPRPWHVAATANEESCSKALPGGSPSPSPIPITTTSCDTWAQALATFPASYAGTPPGRAIPPGPARTPVGAVATCRHR